MPTQFFNEVLTVDCLYSVFFPDSAYLMIHPDWLVYFDASANIFLDVQDTLKHNLSNATYWYKEEKCFWSKDILVWV